MPRRSRRSRYDFLLDVVDKDVQLLVRGKDFDASMPTTSLRQSLYFWARTRGVKINTKTCWRDPDTGGSSGYGMDVPFGLLVKVSSK